MRGGSFDYTMANIVNTDGTTMMSGYSSSQNSGYTGLLYDSGNYGWYSDYSYLAHSNYPWFLRGGAWYNYDLNTGVFYSYYFYGYASYSISSRLIITP